MNALLLLIVITWMSNTQDHVSKGLHLLSQGKINEGVTFLSQLYKKHPSSPETLLAYARIIRKKPITPDIYIQVINNPGSTDSLKSEALYQLGCYYYCTREYKKADSLFLMASNLYSHKKYIQMKAAASFKQESIHAIKLTNTNGSKVSSFPSKTSKQVYTIQVGAFSSLDNAKKMVKTLNPFFTTITIESKQINGSMYHRVRIDDFISKNDALIFGKKHLHTKNIPFRVVLK